MIKLLGICGSPVSGGNTEALLRASLAHVDAMQDVEAEVVTLGDLSFSGCLHCNWCVKKQTEGKFCSQEDDLAAVYPKILAADGIILASPVHFGRLSGTMANMVDRLRAFVHGNLYRERLRNKVGGSLAVAFFRGGGVETTLATLNTVFLVFEMLVATSRLYQIGAAGLSSLDGTGKVTRGVRHMAMEDDFGVASGRMLVDRVIELARIVRAGQEALGK